MSNKNDKFKYFTLVLYPEEDSKHKEIFNYIKTGYACKWCVHDKDDVKSHVHIVWQTPSPRSLESIKKELNVDYVEFVRTIKQMVDYLTHENCSDKYHYSLSELKGDLEISDTNSELYDISLLLEFINSSTTYLYIASLNAFACANGLWSTYRRNCAILLKTLEEHNLFIERMTQNHEH